jgi:hypothetical protein
MPIPSYSKPDEEIRFLDELGIKLASLLGPFKTSNLSGPQGRIGSSVVRCKIGKGKELVKLLASEDFTTMERPALYVYGGVRMEVSGEKTFVTYSSALGILLLGTTITKKPML